MKCAVIAALITLCTTFYATPGEAKQPGAKIELEITSISKLRNARIGSTEAILGLRMKNKGKKSANVHFEYTTGKGAHGEQPGIEIESGGPGHFQSAYGECATLECVWLDQAGTTALKTTKLIAHQTLQLSADDSQSLPVTIDVPAKPGRYKLQVIFSNENLEAIMYTYNFTDHNAVYFSATTSAKVMVNDVAQ
jgi:hypothetical protein